MISNITQTADSVAYKQNHSVMQDDDKSCSYREANHFLKLIAPENKTHCFRVIDPKKKHQAQNYTGTIEELFTQFEHKNIFMRDGIFVVINEGGHKDASIVKIRAVYCDWDEPETAIQLCEKAFRQLEPQIIVESSPGKRHAYWLVNDIAVDRFTLWQEHLIGLFNSDKTIKNTSRVMRLPGFMHTKSDLFQTRIIHESGKQQYCELDLISAFGEPMKSKKSNPSCTANLANSANYMIAESICIDQVTHILKIATPGTRHDARLKAGKLAGGYISGGLVDEAKMIHLLMQVSDRVSDNGVTDASERKTIYDAIEKGKASPLYDLFLSQLKPASIQHDMAGQAIGFELPLPEPLKAPLPAAQSYPVDALGDVLGAAAMAIHETVKAPLALCCQSVLASATLAAQAHFDVRLPWGEKRPLSSFFLTVAESGERKSGVDDVVLRAAKIQERLDMDQYNIERTEYENDLVRWKAAHDTANKTAAKAKNQPARDHAGEAQHLCGQKPAAPIMPLRFVTDPTVEGLFKMLEVNQPSVGLFSDEAGLLIGGHALNNDNALKTMARWCKMWDGAPFDRVRAGDGCNILYGRRLCMHQLAQPEVMVKLLSDRMANGQGLLARCLVAWPESTIGSRVIEKFELPASRFELKRLFSKLKELSEAEPRTAKTPQELDPVELPLDDNAKTLAIEAMNQFEISMRNGNDLAELKDRAAKAFENACRIAGVLAVIDNGLATRSISAAHLERALLLMQWYLSEALRIRGAALVPQPVIDAESLSKWLKDRNMTVFRTSPVLTNGPSHLRNKQRLMLAISELISNGYLVQNETGSIVDGVKAKLSWSVLHHVN